MDTGLIIWEGTWSEIPNGCECGVSDGGLLGYFKLDPDLEMWKGFWSEITDAPLACSRGARRGNLVAESGDFYHSPGNALCECCYLTLKVDEKGN